MHTAPYLNDILILLGVSVIMILLFKQLKLSPVLGYLVAGAMIGPYGFAILETNKTTESIAELGIVFLLFAIGLELNFDKLKKMRKYVLGFGGLQVVITTIAISLICHKFFKLSVETSIVIGSALALSSTAIVLQIISESGESSSRVGRLAFSNLILQDLAVIPILVLLPLLAKENVDLSKALFGAFVNAAIALVIIFAIGRLFLRPIFRYIAEMKNDILFLSITLIVIVGSAQLSSFFGLSSAFGAFTAGLMVAETEYKYRVEEEIMSMKALLMGLFFITIGMSFELDFLIADFPNIVLVAAGLLLVKALIIIVLCRVFRFPLAPSIHTGLLLAQGGEFAFIVFIMAVKLDFLEPKLAQFLATVVTVTMAFTPLLASIGRKIKSQLYVISVLKDNKIKREIGEISNHAILIGFGRIGRVISYILRKKGVNYLILDNNHRVVRLEKANGYNIYYGDAMNIDILRHIGIERCDNIIVAMEDEVACMKITRFIGENFPNINLITKTENINNYERFKKAGAHHIISKNVETGMQLAKTVLISMNIRSKEIEKTLDKVRKNEFNLIKEFLRDKGDGGSLKPTEEKE